MDVAWAVVDSAAVVDLEQEELAGLVAAVKPDGARADLAVAADLEEELDGVRAALVVELVRVRAASAAGALAVVVMLVAVQAVSAVSVAVPDWQVREKLARVDLVAEGRERMPVSVGNVAAQRRADLVKRAPLVRTAHNSTVF